MANESVLASGDALAEALTKIQNLEIALTTNRRIGMAMGIVMARYRVTEEDAFGILRTASQHRHRKLREIAEDAIYTGEIEAAGLRALPPTG
ncbi:MAG TPA: ANTAR domain-containing protein [Jatrophihabitans sp.]|nr:ANTAR domain-containing protein [Jatrophihabitans sp.]